MFNLVKNFLTWNEMNDIVDKATGAYFSVDDNGTVTFNPMDGDFVLKATLAKYLYGVTLDTNKNNADSEDEFLMKVMLIDFDELKYRNVYKQIEMIQKAVKDKVEFLKQQMHYANIKVETSFDNFVNEVSDQLLPLVKEIGGFLKGIDYDMVNSFVQTFATKELNITEEKLVDAVAKSVTMKKHTDDILHQIRKDKGVDNE
ncbi:MAG: hypothetical protein ACLTBR_03520 [Anaerostipes sp.]|uniref:hypothetical protein n=1 Tax=Anaerostipes sp. TaxID=1872530 RepID=UPI003993BA16